MNQNELKEYLKNNLKIEVEVNTHPSAELAINLKLEDEIITSDFIFLEELEQ